MPKAGDEREKRKRSGETEAELNSLFDEQEASTETRGCRDEHIPVKLVERLACLIVSRAAGGIVDDPGRDLRV